MQKSILNIFFAFVLAIISANAGVAQNYIQRLAILPTSTPMVIAGGQEANLRSYCVDRDRLAPPPNYTINYSHVVADLDNLSVIYSDQMGNLNTVNLSTAISRSVVQVSGATSNDGFGIHTKFINLTRNEVKIMVNNHTVISPYENDFHGSGNFTTIINTVVNKVNHNEYIFSWIKEDAIQTGIWNFPVIVRLNNNLFRFNEKSYQNNDHSISDLIFELSKFCLHKKIKESRIESRIILVMEDEQDYPNAALFTKLCRASFNNDIEVIVTNNLQRTYNKIYNEYGDPIKSNINSPDDISVFLPDQQHFSVDDRDMYQSINDLFPNNQVKRISLDTDCANDANFRASNYILITGHNDTRQHMSDLINHLGNQHCLDGKTILWASCYNPSNSYDLINKMINNYGATNVIFFTQEIDGPALTTIFEMFNTMLLGIQNQQIPPMTLSQLFYECASYKANQAKKNSGEGEVERYNILRFSNIEYCEQFNTHTKTK